MPETQIQKILVQSAPAAATPTDVYTAPSQGRAVVCGLYICNRSSGGATLVRLAIVPDGEGPNPSNKHYVLYDYSIPINSAYKSKVPIYMNSSAHIWVQSDIGSATFNIFGTEE